MSEENNGGSGVNALAIVAIVILVLVAGFFVLRSGVLGGGEGGKNINVDLKIPAVLETIPVPDSPAGLALLGDFLYVTHFWSGDVSLVYLPESRVAQTITTGLDTSISSAIELDVTRGLGFIRANW